MLCSWKNIKQRSSWDNDSTILYTGLILLTLYMLLTYIISLFLPEHIVSLTFKHVHKAFDISKETESQFISYFSMIWHIFWISAIAGFIGIPIARVFEGCLSKQTELQYSKLAENIQTKGTSYACKWNNILLILQEKHYISELNQLKKYIINGEVLAIPHYNGVLASIRHLNRISNILLEIENIMQKEVEACCERKLSFYRSRIRLLLFKTDFYKHLTTLQYFIVPACVALCLSYLFEGVNYLALSKGTFSFFLGAVLIILSLQFSTLAYSAIGLFGYLWRKQSKRFDDMIFKIYALSISLIVFITVFMSGVYVFSPSDNESLVNLRVLFTTSGNIIIPLINVGSEYNLIRHLPPGIQFVIQVSTAIVVSMLLQLSFKFVLGKYKQSTSGEDEKHFTIPAELISIFGAFFIFIIATGLIYSALVSKNQINESSSFVKKSSYESQQYNYKEGGNSAHVSAKVKADASDGSPKSIGNFLPYSIFLALVGAVLAISTRELLENYFAGISMKVDMPFEQGDRIDIDGVGMCEVREIGLRSVNLYSIANNSIVSIPNKDMSNGHIENYTQPTLDYRRSLTLSIASDLNSPFEKLKNKNKLLLEKCKRNSIASMNCSSFLDIQKKECKQCEKALKIHKEQEKIKHDFRFIKDCRSHKSWSVVELSKSLLLVSSYLTTGVQRPSAKRFFCYNWALENKGADVESPDRGMKHSAIRDIKSYSKRAPVLIDKHSDLFNALESVAVIQDYRDVDKKELDLIWSRLILIQKIDEQPLIDLLLMDVPHLLDDASMIEQNIKFMDTDYVSRSKVRVAKILYLLHILESEEYGLSERDFAGSKRMPPYKAWGVSHYITCLSEQYFSINELLWGLKSQSDGQAGKKTIDSARLKFQNLPRVKCEQKHSTDGYLYWEFTLFVTVSLGEQSDEILYNINKRIDWYWEYTNLSKIMFGANSN